MKVPRTLAVPLLFAGISIAAVETFFLVPVIILHLGPPDSGVYTLPAWYWRDHPVMMAEQVISIAAPIILGTASTIAGLLLSRNGKRLITKLQ